MSIRTYKCIGARIIYQHWSFQSISKNGPKGISYLLNTGQPVSLTSPFGHMPGGPDLHSTLHRHLGPHWAQQGMVSLSSPQPANKHLIVSENPNAEDRITGVRRLQLTDWSRMGTSDCRTLATLNFMFGTLAIEDNVSKALRRICI